MLTARMLLSAYLALCAIAAFAMTVREEEPKVFPSYVRIVVAIAHASILSWAAIVVWP